MGMVISQKSVKYAAIHNVLKEVWARFGSVSISYISDKEFLFEFEDEKDREQIIDISL